ncbi:ATP-grasp domain-containing protein [Candidatus Woesearchaeota archaeon]|nr:ATP-grasp domain-containing protein [Candidatus Woesearchaeota archaeon]
MKTIGILFGEYLQWDDYPFSKKRTNKAYSLFSSIGIKKDVRFLISSFKQLENGILKKAWVYDDMWQLVENREIEIIFDRSETNNKNDEKKEDIGKKIRIFNNSGLNKLCWDKMQTYDYFSKLVPRTFAVNNIKEVKEVLPMIGSDTVVLKPRYGVMGKDIQFLKKKKIKEVKKNFVVQEFIDSSKGIKELGIEGVHDLRVVIVNDEIDHSYVRIAEKGSLFANCAKGGKKVFLDKEKIPNEVLEIVKEVDSKFERYEPRIYSIDFVYDKNGKIWVAELESIPGFAYYEDAEEIRNEFLNKMVDVLKAIEPISEEEIKELERIEEEMKREAEEKRILREAKRRKIEEGDQEEGEERLEEEEEEKSEEGEQEESEEEKQD